jgi:GNAT superfamily N-acetyltransferase
VSDQHQSRIRHSPATHPYRWANPCEGTVSAFRVSTDPAELDVSMIHRFLSTESYWAPGISRFVLERALAHSLCFGGYLDRTQVAFARVVTDCATYAHLKDVFVLSAFRGGGFGTALMQAVMAHSDLLAVSFTLATDDAHALYDKFGFVRPTRPERSMVRPGTFLDSVERE